MTSHVTCPCCSENLLHHISGSRDYWYCPSCREEMPNLDAIKGNELHRRQNQIISLSISSINLDLTPKMALA